VNNCQVLGFKHKPVGIARPEIGSRARGVGGEIGERAHDVLPFHVLETEVVGRIGAQRRLPVKLP
jgi:hypothetical protein